MQRQESNFSEDVKAYQPQNPKRKQTWNTSNAADAHAEVMAEYLAESVSRAAVCACAVVHRDRLLMPDPARHTIGTRAQGDSQLPNLLYRCDHVYGSRRLRL
jgi:hypothetical protein